MSTGLITFVRIQSLTAGMALTEVVGIEKISPSSAEAGAGGEATGRHILLRDDRTIVRVHRASEGAPYTGLKPAGVDLGPAVPAADRALDTGSTESLERLLGDAMRRSPLEI